jgi:hypothetical protein
VKIGHRKDKKYKPLHYWNSTSNSEGAFLFDTSIEIDYTKLLNLVDYEEKLSAF